MSKSTMGYESHSKFAMHWGSEQFCGSLFQKREFHVRWKGWGPEGDTMEPEDNLDCPDLIEKFMANHEKSQMTSTKMVRLHGFHKYLIQWTYG